MSTLRGEDPISQRYDVRLFKVLKKKIAKVIFIGSSIYNEFSVVLKCFDSL
jgi:hypothetical protein